MLPNNELTRIRRGLRRRINRGNPLDSYPFLSGDSYFYSCEFYFELGEIKRVPVLFSRPKKPFSLFVRISWLKNFLTYLDLHPEFDYTEDSLVLHNGDDMVTTESLRKLTSRFKKVFSVNLLGAVDSVHAIPIGLENRNFFTNGVPEDFKRMIRDGLKISDERSNLLLQSFSCQTNIVERKLCSRVASLIGTTTVKDVSPMQYRKATADSRFVLSPAGNGFDCHRTWEAMYLGATPILRRSHWPFININLPVLLVDEWEDLLKIDLNLVSVPRNPTWSEDFWNRFFND